jgi:hypothetical protein
MYYWMYFIHGSYIWPKYIAEFQQNSEQTGKYNVIKKDSYEMNHLFESFRELIPIVLNLMGCSNGQIQKWVNSRLFDILSLKQFEIRQYILVKCMSHV